MGEYYAILIAMVLGMFLMASATDMLMMFLSLELVSISSYILTGYLKGQVRSSEASLKYIIYGAVSSGLMIYGISILYGLTGHTNIFKINEFLVSHPVDGVTLLLAALLIMAGFGYKIGAVPFHFWSPDVYEGAPTPVTAFLSVGSKAAGFAMLIRFFRVTVPTGTGEGIIGVDWVTMLSVFALVSMILGNVVAIWQSSVKRMLGLALVGILTSVISLYYYFKIPLNMYLRESEDGSTSELSVGVWSNAMVGFLAVLTVVLGLFFTPLANLTKNSVGILGTMLLR
jgi:NADH-quinone oxidoreductase subunit N